MCPDFYILGFRLDSYLILYLIALVVGIVLLRYELKRKSYPPFLYVRLVIVALAAGMVGSKLYYIVEAWREVGHSPVTNFFKVSGSGWYGGFVLAGFSIALVLKIEKLPVLKTLDVLAPILPVCQILGRFGCFLAGCCHGRPSNLPWAVSFPDGLFPPSVKVHPTQIYEMIILAGVALVLWRLRDRELKTGVKLSLYLVLAGSGRFLVEFLRLNPKVALGLTAPQIFAFSGIILGLLIMMNTGRKLPQKSVIGGS